MSSWATQLNTVTLFVDDLPATRQFYQDVFDLPVHFEDSESAVFKIGSVLVNLASFRDPAGHAWELAAPIG